MARRLVALIAGALLVVGIAGCGGPPPSPVATVVVTTNAQVDVILQKLPGSSGVAVGGCHATSAEPCIFTQTAAELAAQPDGYYVSISYPFNYSYSCTATDLPAHPASAPIFGVYGGLCVYDGGTTDAVTVHGPKLAAGSTTNITVTFPP